MSSKSAYDALPSETASTSPTLCQPESQLKCEEVESSAVLHTSKICSRTCVSWSWASWEWEFAACLLVLATPIIIFATLYPHSGQPLPQWPFKVSINSLLSVYGLGFKAVIGFILTSCIGQLQWAWFSDARPLTDVLHFDSATRGADGALGLIWRQKFQQPLTAIGCIIMVLVVAVDPFVQQLVRPVDCSVEVSGDHASATLPRANVFEHYGYDMDTDITTINLGIGFVTTDRADRAERAIGDAMYSALFSPGQDPPWRCPTGNCTFPDTYGTIGLCYSCQDASTDVKINNTCSPPDSSYASHHPTSVADCNDKSNFTVESNIIVDEYNKLGTKMMFTTDGFVGGGDVAAAFSAVEPSSALPGATRSLLFRFLLGATVNAGGRTDWTTSDNTTCNSTESKGSWACQGYGAATCSLQPCVQIYNATISAGVLEEDLVASSADAAWGTVYLAEGHPEYLALVDTHCSAGMQTLTNRNSSAGSRWLPYNFNLAEEDVERHSNGTVAQLHLPEDVTSLLDNGCLYLISAESIMGPVAAYLEGTVQGYATSIMIDSSDHREYTYTIEKMSGFRGPELIQRIYNWGHTDLERVQSIFANISGSLTTYIRAHGGSQLFPDSINFSRNTQGRMYRYATCLQVQWPWIAFPACLAILTALFFLTVVEVTKRRGTSVWKVSPLAWILRADGLDKEQYSSSTKQCEGMKETSRSIAVHILDEGRDGPRIRMADVKDPNLL